MYILYFDAIRRNRRWMDGWIVYSPAHAKQLGRHIPRLQPITDFATLRWWRRTPSRPSVTLTSHNHDTDTTPR